MVNSTENGHYLRVTFQQGDKVWVADRSDKRNVIGPGIASGKVNMEGAIHWFVDFGDGKALSRYRESDVFSSDRRAKSSLLD